MDDDEALDTPASTLEELLSIDLLSATLELLPARDLGAACCACQRWAETLAHPAAWKQAGRAEGLIWAETEGEAEARAAAQGGWKQMFRKERTLEKRWVHYGLQPRVIAQGHDHWVPSILMEPRSRQLVTCSYDGTIRFWSDVDVAEPQCFKIVHGAEGEGFSSIAMSSRCTYEGTSYGDAAAPRLAAGSELGSVHVWEVWCPDDSEEARAAAAEARATAALGEWPTTELALSPLHLTAGGGGEGEEYGGMPGDPFAMAVHQAETGNERPLSQVLLARARPRFARKLECWTGSHDFVQSILMLPDGRTVVSGGDSGNVTLHQVGEPGQPSRTTPSVRLVGHQSAVMCLGATASGEVLSGSVDHGVRLWDVHRGACKQERLGRHP
jgi:WD40 repeat protein